MTKLLDAVSPNLNSGPVVVETHPPNSQAAKFRGGQMILIGSESPLSRIYSIIPLATLKNVLFSWVWKLPSYETAWH